ncbi:response regulator transcription factor [Bythopirellula polymerisocia]|uniref:Alkaline phosphatase synthesis transcriptional regulatory protein PhoP n=1 Tax=Bythopirellula polymerisocia TaxID=2528003 RepID=A0A5C6CKE2_9BACT|nr:response regulator transcription factor [Bythopirellula polymerisocia]TWU24535.1 Alkaline phosphatase synthesis transcriptional regulatory protein PhoP [Bythopirellula polymerisocia]
MSQVGHQQRILIVEDDATLLRGLSDNFAVAGFDVQTATDGQAGIAHVLADPPDLLVLDIMMPRMNGYDLCRRVRQAMLDMPILMLTAKGQEEDIVRGLELGADDYMTKPFGMRELLARVKTLLRRQGNEMAERMVIGDLLFDRTSHTLTRDGQEIPLTSKEYALLEYFCSRPNRALTRGDIISHVWGRSIIVSGRSVDRCVATLRSKIEPTPSQPQFIHTIRDVGYRFGLPE